MTDDPFHLTYRGDRTAAVGTVLGPDELGQWKTIKTAVYNPDTDRTRVGLTYSTPAELQAAIGHPGART